MAISIGQTSITPTNADLLFYLDSAISYNYTLSDVEVLVVAGGGGGGGWGGGGGGGGVVYNRLYPVTPGTGINISIGNGGSPGTNAYTSGGDGGSSVFGTITAIGGGGGGHYNGNNGRAGGSGGGGGGASNATYGFVTTGGSGTPRQGNNGGRGGGIPDGSIYNPGGGGGGAGERGYDFDINLRLGGKGGDGLPFNISGRLKYYGGGGGGHTDGRGGTVSTSFGGKGGGGRGGNYGIPRRGLDGAPNTGGGGGGSYGTTSGYECGAGGSGVVIIRYPGLQKASGGNTITQVDGYTIHTFTSGGTFTPNTAPTNGGGLNGLQDLGPNGYNFYQVNTPTYNTSRSGTIDFNGTSAYLESVLPTRYSAASVYTINMWFKINGAPSGASGNQANFLIDLDVTGGSFNGLIVDWQPYLSGSSQMRFAYATRPSSGGSYTPLLGSVLTQGVWYNGCVVKNGTTETRLYLNGSLESTYSGNMPSWGTNTVRIARWTDGTVYSNCSVGVVWVQNKALTASEVLQNFNALKGRYQV